MNMLQADGRRYFSLDDSLRLVSVNRQIRNRRDELRWSHLALAL